MDIPVEVWIEICKVIRVADLADFEAKGRPKTLLAQHSPDEYHPEPPALLTHVRVAMRLDTSVPWPEKPIVASPSLCAFASACRFFRMVASSFLFERVRITPLDQKDEKTLTLFKKRVNALTGMGEHGPLGHIRELSVHSHQQARGLVLPIARLLIRHTPRLRRLELVDLAINSYLLNAIHSLSDLRHLKLMHCVYHSNISPLVPLHSRLNLHSLLVRNKPRQTNGSHWQASIKSLAGPELTHLCVSLLTFGDWPVLPRLRHLTIETATIVEEAHVVALLRILEGSPELQALEIPDLRDAVIDRIPPLIHLKSIACDLKLLPTMMSGRPVEVVSLGSRLYWRDGPDLVATLSQSTKPIRSLSTTGMGNVGMWRSNGVEPLIEKQPHLEQFEIWVSDQQEASKFLQILARLSRLRKVTLARVSNLELEWQEKTMHAFLQQTSSPVLSEVSLIHGTTWRKWWFNGNWILDDGEESLYERRF